MKISSVPKEEIVHIWGTVEPMLARAVAYSTGRYDAIDLYVDIIRGEQSLWIAFDEERVIHGVCTMRVVAYPCLKVLRIEALAGDSLRSWIREAFAVACRYGRDMECVRMEAFGRKSWRRLIERLGGKMFAVQYEFDLKGN